MSDIMDNLFGPLGAEYCLYFYALSIFGYVMLIVFLLGSITYGISRKKGGEYYMGMLSIAAGYFIFYFQNRLLHTMCIHKQ
jgi:hypothetical protein